MLPIVIAAGIILNFKVTSLSCLFVIILYKSIISLENGMLRLCSSDTQRSVTQHKLWKHYTQAKKRCVLFPVTQRSASAPADFRNAPQENRSQLYSSARTVTFGQSRAACCRLSAGIFQYHLRSTQRNVTNATQCNARRSVSLENSLYDRFQTVRHLRLTASCL